MRVHYRSLLARLLLPRRYVAITLLSHVHTRESRLDERVLRHERAHVEQWKRHGALGFLLRYLWCHLRHGYVGNPFEVEAREAERRSDAPVALGQRGVGGSGEEPLESS